ncbi:MAG TPA: zinc-binding alcohol dehydrogenase [Ktedonobacteraceae bacterium]|jgi:threonine dehydrogenase-like Zn-dependent dehydrogenase
MYQGLYVDKPQSIVIREEQEIPLETQQARIRTSFASVKHGTEFHQFSGESPFHGRVFDPELRLFVQKPEEEASDVFEQRFVGNMVVGTVVEVGSSVSRVNVGDQVYCYGPACELVTKSQDEIKLLQAPMSALDAVCLDPAFFAFAAVRDSGARLGNTVVVFGLGAIGLLVIQMLHLSGCMHIIAVDPLERRRKLALSYGAQTAIDPTVDDIGLVTRDLLNGRGADIAIEASGNYRGLQGALRAVHNTARVVTLGYYKGRDNVLELGAEWHHNRLELISSMPVWNNPFRDPLWDRARMTEAVAELFKQKLLVSEGIIDPIVDFADSPRAFMDIYHNPSDAIKLGITF